MDHKRLLLALLLSAAILFGWELFIRRFDSPPPNNIDPSQQTVASSPSQPNEVVPSLQTEQRQNSSTISDDVQQRTVTIVTPLYEVKLDNRGAVATSWIIKQNKETGRLLYSVAGSDSNRQSLELIPSESVRQKQGEVPLRLVTGDVDLDNILTSKKYTISGAEGDAPDLRLEINSGEPPKRVEFNVRDEVSGLDVTKSMTFSPDHYSVDFSVQIKLNNQNLSNLRLAIGPSIGDQGVPSYTFYSVAPEGIAAVGGEVVRLLATSIHNNEGGWFTSKRPEGPDRQVVGGGVDWAGVGDTYFAMVGVLPQPLQGLEYRTTKYEHQANGVTEDRFLITGYVPVPSDGTTLRLYVGPKDHYLLTGVSEEISQSVGRQVDLEGLIDYGLFSSVSRPLAVPILWSLKRLSSLTNSYGVAIILFTVIIYSLFFPLKWRSSKAMKQAQKLAPRMKELQEKIKELKQSDPRLKELQMEQLRLMKEGNPLGGCLPLLIQMPFLFALFRAITISIDFRQASFLWMPDLSTADPIHLLPILMAGSMLVLQLITPAPSADPLQRKMMAVVLPVMMLYMMWSAPAGLLVYWLVGNIVGFSQQLLINRLIKSGDDEEPPEKNHRSSSRNLRSVLV